MNAALNVAYLLATLLLRDFLELFKMADCAAASAVAVAVKVMLAHTDAKVCFIVLCSHVSVQGSLSADQHSHGVVLPMMLVGAS